MSRIFSHSVGCKHLIVYGWCIVCRWSSGNFVMSSVVVGTASHKISVKTCNFRVLQGNEKNSNQARWEVIPSFNCQFSTKHSCKKIDIHCWILKLQLKMSGILFIGHIVQQPLCSLFYLCTRTYTLWVKKRRHSLVRNFSKCLTFSKFFHC